MWKAAQQADSEHRLLPTAAIDRLGNTGMWEEFDLAAAVAVYGYTFWICKDLGSDWLDGAEIRSHLANFDLGLVYSAAIEQRSVIAIHKDHQLEMRLS